MIQIERRWGLSPIKYRREFPLDEAKFYLNNLHDEHIMTMYVTINGDVQKFKGKRRDLYKEIQWMFI